ncbi:MAG TPA: bifunctional DNA-formamidopyrimidine glycosylase/DNA-(apurinic or apyrimidinic site) lyase [Gemmatimonadaceae bacterium]|nr:bifunctional DNA-formamidopyrimidine glycosylase/DNA-(apurinic or apyrimidinic site) lyase [Gemmatimonadaceae bacterium]
MAGSTIVGVRVRHADVLREVGARAFANRITGTTIMRAWRRAKLVVLDLSSGDRLVIQPRFTGAMLIDASDDERRYVTVTFALDDGRELQYRDIRRLGTLSLMTPKRFEAYVGALGIEPLDSAFTSNHLSQLLARSRQAVKKVLMDQRLVAGIGNIYANEALWRAGIDPSREAKGVSPTEAGTLREAIVDVLTEAIAARGTSFRDYRDAKGERGSFAAQLAAYGRGGRPCGRCGARLVETHAVDGRTTVFCAYCQR